MPRSGDLFGVDTDPDVMAARQEYDRRFKLNKTARIGTKMKRQAELEVACDTLLKAELTAAKRIKEMMQ